MLSFEEIHDTASQVFENEANAIKNIIPLLDQDFERVVQLILVQMLSA